MNGRIKCANPSCISLLRRGKKEGEVCDCCSHNGKEANVILESHLLEGRRKSFGGMSLNSHIRYNGN